MQDDELKALVEQLRSLVTCGCDDDEAGQIGAKAATALETLAREKAEFYKERVEYETRILNAEIAANEARAEVERLRLGAAEDRLTIADLTGAHGIACTQLTATQARLEEGVQIIRNLAEIVEEGSPLAWGISLMPSRAFLAQQDSSQ